MSSFRVDKSQYIPTDEEGRISRYNKDEYIFCGDHRSAFKPTINPSKGDNNLYMEEQMGQLISHVGADMLFAEPIMIKSNEEDDEFLDDFQKRNPELQNMLWEAALGNSYFGDVVVEMKKPAEGDDEGDFQFIDPRHWFPKLNASGVIESHELCFIIKKGKDRYLYKRIHFKNKIENRVYKIKERSMVMYKGKPKGAFSEKDLSEVSLQSVGLNDIVEVEENNTGEFMVKQIPNMRMMNHLYGYSDYMGKDSLMNALNQTTSFAQMILEKHSDPAMQVPQGTIDRDGNVYVKEQKLFQVDGEQSDITKYITWDGKLEFLFQQRTHIIDMLALYSEMSTGLLGKDTGGTIPESGRALRIKYARAIQKTSRKRRHWEAGIKYILRMSQKLRGIAEPIDYGIQWRDVFDESYLEFLEEKRKERDLGILSNESIIEEALKQKNYSDEQIALEKERILKQKKDDQAVTAPAGMGLFKRETDLKPQENGNPKN